MKRVLIAALLGGIAAFVWSFVSHVVLPLGEAGIRGLPEDGAVLSALRSGLPEEGVYLFPGDPGDDSPEAMERWAEQYRTGPTGFLVYRPIGGEFSFPRHLSFELLSNILAALIAAAIVAHTPGSYLMRVLTVAGLGVFAWLSISASYWNWYGFPGTFVLAEAFDQLMSWLVAGLVIAKVAPGATRA